MTVTDKAIVSKVREIIKSDGSYTIRDIAKAFSIGLLRMNIIFMRILKVRKISARWLAHILTDDQIQVRLQTAKQLLKCFPNSVNSVEHNLPILLLMTKHGLTISNQ